MWRHLRSLQETFGYSAAGKLGPLISSSLVSPFAALNRIVLLLQASRQTGIQEGEIENDAQVSQQKILTFHRQWRLCFLFDQVTITCSWLIFFFLPIYINEVSLPSSGSKRHRF